jgi:hypothetical protein
VRSLTLISSFSPLLVSTDNSFAVFNVRNNPVQAVTAQLLGTPSSSRHDVRHESASQLSAQFRVNQSMQELSGSTRWAGTH